MKTRKTKSGSIIDMDATIVCERDSHKGIIIGKQGSMLKKIGTNARYEMERLLDCKVNLKAMGQGKEGLERQRLPHQELWIQRGRIVF